MSLITIFLRSGVVAVALLLGFSVAAWSSPSSAPPNGFVSTTIWNSSGGNIVFTGGNVGLETGSPSAKLEVGGTLKASKLESTQVPTIRVSLSNTCPNNTSCPGVHGLGAWFDIGVNYNHSVSNNDTSAYTTANGRVTVLKAGTYRVRISSMVIPAVAAGGLYVAPFINGAASAPTGDIYHHRYMPAGWWSMEIYENTITVAAGTTVSYGYHPTYNLSYWAHEGYTSMEIVRIN